MYASTRCIVLVVVALLALSSTLASPYSGSVQRDALVRGTRRMTNAERLARGLPPNKPELRRSPTHERRGASATITTTSSSIPTSGPTSGVIKATTGCGNGYLGTNLALRDVSVAGIFEVDLSRDNGSSGPLNFLCTNCDSRPGLSLGVAAPDNSFAFVQSDVEVDGSLTLGYETQPYAIAQADAVNNGGRGVETTIWYLDPSTNIITPKWVNPDGNIVPLYLGCYVSSAYNYFSLSISSPYYAYAATFQWSPLQD